MTILVVEHNEDTAFLMETLLSEDFDITLAYDAESAEEEARRQRFDLLQLDINLPGGASGVDLLEQLRAVEWYREAPIAAATAYALPGDRERYLQAGFDAYLAKPFAPEDLIALVSELADSASA